MAEHGAILQRLAQRDSEGAAQAMKAHVQNGLSVVVASLKASSQAPT